MIHINETVEVVPSDVKGGPVKKFSVETYSASQWEKTYIFRSEKGEAWKLERIKQEKANGHPMVVDRVDNSHVTQTVKNHLEEQGYELK